MWECATVNVPLIADANADATSPARPLVELAIHVVGRGLRLKQALARRRGL